MPAYLSRPSAARSTPASPFWTPAALSSPPVAYPLPSGAAATTPLQRMTTAAYLNAMRARAGTTPYRSAENTFGVKTGDWGGNIMGGTVKSGDFGNPSPDTKDIRWTNNTVGAPGSGGTAPSGYSNDLAGRFQEQFDRANQANEARYQDVLGGYQSRYQRGLSMLAGLGQQEGRDINELYDAQGAKINQNLIGRGLGNSTITSTMAMGNERERNADLGRLNKRVRQQALAQDAGLSGDTLQFMERKTENAPSMELLDQLAQGVGAAGGGLPPAGMYDGDVGMGGGGYGFNPYFGGGYMPRGNNFLQQQQAAAQANLAAAAPGKPIGLTANQRYGYSGTGPVRRGYALRWLPTNVKNAYRTQDPEWMAWAGR